MIDSTTIKYLNQYQNYMRDKVIWLEQAKQDFATADHDIQGEFYDAAAFHLQQAVEKSLKYALLKEDHGVLQTHDCLTLAKKLDAPQTIVETAERFTPYYFRTRYPDAETVHLEQDDAERLRQAANEVLQWIQEHYSNG